MSNPRYPKEFKIEAVKQMTECGLPAAELHRLRAELKRVTVEK